MNPQDRRWLRADEVSELLHLSVKNVYRAVKSGKLPGRKVPGIGVRLDRLAIDRMLEGMAPAVTATPMPTETKKARRGRKQNEKTKATEE
jgi:excisionase family DNA binding protein